MTHLTALAVQHKASIFRTVFSFATASGVETWRYRGWAAKSKMDKMARNGIYGVPSGNLT